MAPNDLQVQLALGVNYLDANQADDAVALFQAAISQESKDPRPYYILEQALLRKGLQPGSSEFQDASQAISKTLAVDPNFVWGYVERARLALKEGETNRALSDLRQARSLNPYSGTIDYLLAQTYQRTGEKTKASELFARLEKSSRVEAENYWKKNMWDILVTIPPEVHKSFEAGPHDSH